MFARAAGAEVHVMGRSEESLLFARSLGFEYAWTEASLPNQPFDAVIDASNAAHLLLSPSTWSSRPDGSSISAWPVARSHRHPDLGPQGRHRGWHSVGLSRPRRHHHGLREQCGRSPSTGRRDRKPRAGRRRACQGPAGRRLAVGPRSTSIRSSPEGTLTLGLGDYCALGGRWSVDSCATAASSFS